MDSISSYDANKYSYRQGSMITLPDEDDEKTYASDPSMRHPYQEAPAQQHGSTTSVPSANVAKVPSLDDSHSPQTDFQTSSGSNNEDTIIQNWPHLTDTAVTTEQRYHTLSQSDSTNDVTASFSNSQHQDSQMTEQEAKYDFFQQSAEEISSSMDYETLIRTKQLFFDPNPETVRRPQKVAPLVYKQNITIKFLKPPAVPQGPLIIREVRPPQPPPPPPLIIRQRPPPPLSPPPIILREKPPRIPITMTAQVLTKTLPLIPPPPRSVIIEKLPPLPPKPRDVIIERWIPYEANMQKRKVVVQRAEEPKAYPQPRNIIVEYEKVESRVIRQVERLGVSPEDPENYAARYGTTLLDTDDLLAQVKQLGIVEDLSLPRLPNYGFGENLPSTSSEQQFPYQSSFSIDTFDRRSPRGSASGGYATTTTDPALYSDINSGPYAPTYENLVHGSGLSVSFDQLNEHSSAQELDVGEDLSTQLAQYGLTAESIPY